MSFSGSDFTDRLKPMCDIAFMPVRVLCRSFSLGQLNLGVLFGIIQY